MLTIGQIIAALGLENISESSSDQEIQHLVTDSRTYFGQPASLFVALKGPHFNGHHYVAEAAEKGCKFFLISEDISVEDRDIVLLRVKDTLQAMQQLAKLRRTFCHFPLVGITGSNGKTIVKEWLFQLLQHRYKVSRSPKSYNSQVGVALSVWNLDTTSEIALIEAGISRPDEMEKLWSMIQPQIGVFTNLGSAHDVNFSNRLQKAREKVKLFEGTDCLIYCRDHDLVHQVIDEKGIGSDQLFSWSRKSKADLTVTRINRQDGKTQIQAIVQNRFVEISIPFTDEASLENAISCWCVLLHLGFPDDEIATGMAALTPVAMRLEIRNGINQCYIINDTYTSDWESFCIALEFLKKQVQEEAKTIILSDFAEISKSEPEFYSDVAERLSQSGISRIIGIGRKLKEYQSLFPDASQFFETTEEFLIQFRTSMFFREVILVKGSRQFGFERISSRLQQKAHETVLEINLDSLIHNVKYFKSLLRPGVKMMAVVKAFGYGTGSTEIARVLQLRNLDYLAVAYADEGVELRQAGIKLPIMVMNPSPADFDNLLEYDLEPEVYNLRTLKYLKESLSSAILPGNLLKIHIKLDTGMHRLGMSEEDLNDAIRLLHHERKIRVVSVFSHLAASDDPELDTFTRRQIRLFEKMSAHLQEFLEYTFDKHILNSGGIARFPDAQFQMVRLGLGMHGISSSQDEQAHLIPTATLRTVVSQLRTVTAGDAVGYGRHAVLDKTTRIAVVPVGYADGYSRFFGNGKGFMLVNGSKAPTVGNICMDMTMLDVTDLNVEEGDEVIVFGPALPVAELAGNLATIPYEVLSGVSARVKRVYFHE